jgi:hypothetical protein
LCPLAQPLIKAATPAIKNAITPNKAEKLLALIDSPKPAIERKTRIHEPGGNTHPLAHLSFRRTIPFAILAATRFDPTILVWHSRPGCDPILSLLRVSAVCFCFSDPRAITRDVGDSGSRAAQNRRASTCHPERAAVFAANEGPKLAKPTDTSPIPSPPDPRLA